MDHNTQWDLSKSLTSENILNKLKLALGLKNDFELAALFKVGTSTLSGWKGRDSVDFKKVLEICYERNVSILWLFYESGDMLHPNSFLHRNMFSSQVRDAAREVTGNLFKGYSEQLQNPYMPDYRADIELLKADLKKKEKKRDHDTSYLEKKLAELQKKIDDIEKKPGD